MGLASAKRRGAVLQRELTGCHEVYVGPATRWRLIIQNLDAPTSSQHRREI
ncbi:hypothetical protein ACWD6P_12880 [Streptomyces sp. NPDC002446]